MIKTLHARMRFPRLGVIRLGVKEISAKGKEYGKEVAWFVLPAELRRAYGDQPTKLPVLFPSDDIDRVLTYAYEEYGGRLLKRKCDGETYQDFSGRETRRAPCEREQGCKCQAKARLNVILLKAQLGVYQVLIGGEQRIADLLAQLEIYAHPQALGRLRGILFEIERVPTEIQIRREDGTRIPRTGYPVRLRCNFTAEEIAIARKIDYHALEGVVEETEHEAVADISLHPLLRDESLPASPAESGGALGLQGDEWDISMCFRAAQQLGVPPAQYRTYLEHVYKTDVDNLDLVALADQANALKQAGAEPKAGALWAEGVRLTLRRIANSQPIR